MYTTVNQISGAYDYAGFVLNTGTSNYNVKTNQASLFLLVPIATKIFIWADQNISFSFNSTSYPSIPLNVGNGESPAEFKGLITANNIFLTNVSGTNANIKILLGV